MSPSIDSTTNAWPSAAQPPTRRLPHAIWAPAWACTRARRYEPGLVDALHGILVARIPADFTTCFVNEYHDHTRRQTIESVAEKLTYEQILPEWRNPPIVHLGPLCQEIDAGLVNRFGKSLVGVTPQGWMREWGEDGLVRAIEWPDAERVLPRADVVIISENDVADKSVIQDWAAKARMLVVTLGERGCHVYKQGEPAPYHAPAFKSGAEVDPTGAGDVFAAAFLWHLHSRRRRLAQGGRLGELRGVVRGRKTRRRGRPEARRGRKTLA